MTDEEARVFSPLYDNLQGSPGDLDQPYRPDYLEADPACVEASKGGESHGRAKGQARFGSGQGRFCRHRPVVPTV